MARRTFATELSRDDLEKLNRLIRKYQYTHVTEVAAWLNKRGNNASRTAVGRYMQALQRQDGVESMTSMEISIRASEGVNLTRREQIIMELGQMKLREIELFEELRDTGI